MARLQKKEWLKNAVFYQIYPTSFYDSNGDGIGDINGIIQKLDYVQKLGCNGIWLNPCFKSAFRDGGYDVIDYYKVDPRFGTNEDLVRLFEAARQMGIKVILDLIVGHTSDQCEWFIQSSKKEKNEYSDYYIWTDCVWENRLDYKMVNGTAERDGNYITNFFAFQPALNFGFVNPQKPWQKHYLDKSFEKMHDLVIDIMEFWLGKGADGFRVDMADSLIKGDDNGEANAWLWDKLITRIEQKYPDAIFVSEWCNPPVAVAKGKFDIDFMIHIRGQGYNSLFRYEKDVKAYGPYQGQSYFRKNSSASFEPFASEYLSYISALNGKGYLSIPSGNHDLSRISIGRTDEEIIAAMAFVLTIKSVPFIYYGDEIGMRYIEGLSKDGGYDRTGSRTPMQWDTTKNKGFSRADQIYLPVHDDDRYTVERQEKCDGSILNYTKELINIRKTYSALWADSEIEFLSEYEDDILVYSRKSQTQKMLVCINCKGAKKSMQITAKNFSVISSLNAQADYNSVCFADTGYIILLLED